MQWWLWRETGCVPNQKLWSLVHMYVGIIKAFSMWRDLSPKSKLAFRSVENSFQSEDFDKTLLFFYCLCSNLVPFVWFFMCNLNRWDPELFSNSGQIADMTKIVLELTFLPGLFLQASDWPMCWLSLWGYIATSWFVVCLTLATTACTCVAYRWDYLKYCQCIQEVVFFLKHKII